MTTSELYLVCLRQILVNQKQLLSNPIPGSDMHYAESMVQAQKSEILIQRIEEQLRS